MPSETKEPLLHPEAVEDIEFIDPGQLVDGDLELRLIHTTPADHARGFAPVYGFAMMKRGSEVVMGNINLRVGSYSESRALSRPHWLWSFRAVQG